MQKPYTGQSTLDSAKHQCETVKWISLQRALSCQHMLIQATQTFHRDMQFIEHCNWVGHIIVCLGLKILMFDCLQRGVELWEVIKLNRYFISLSEFVLQIAMDTFLEHNTKTCIHKFIQVYRSYKQIGTKNEKIRSYIYKNLNTQTSFTYIQQCLFLCHQAL